MSELRYAPSREDVMDVFRAAENERLNLVLPGTLRQTLENILSRVYREGRAAKDER